MVFFIFIIIIGAKMNFKVTNLGIYHSDHRAVKVSLSSSWVLSRRNFDKSTKKKGFTLRKFGPKMKNTKKYLFLLGLLVIFLYLVKMLLIDFEFVLKNRMSRVFESTSESNRTLHTWSRRFREKSPTPLSALIWPRFFNWNRNWRLCFVRMKLIGSRDIEWTGWLMVTGIPKFST